MRCDTPNDEEDREPCEEEDMPNVYLYRTALLGGRMVAEDPITALFGRITYSDTLGMYFWITGLIKINVGLHERLAEVSSDFYKDGELANTIIHENLHRVGIVSEMRVQSITNDIIKELFGAVEAVAGICGVNWEHLNQ